MQENLNEKPTFLTNGIIQLNDSIAQKGTWQYIAQGILPSAEGNAIIPISNGNKGKVRVIIDTVFSPEKIPFFFGRNTEHNLLIPENIRVQCDLMLDGLQKIFNGLLTQTWLIIGKVKQNNRADIPISILYFEPMNIAFYGFMSLQEKQAIDENKQRLLN